MTAYVFPGQGSQFIGMGKDLYDAYSNARIWFEHANDILGFNLTDIMFKADERDAACDLPAQRGEGQGDGRRVQTRDGGWAFAR